jgi:hypothetical protein
VGVYAVYHERPDRARRVVFTCIAGVPQVIKDLFVDVAEVLPLGEIIRVNFVNFVNDLPHELAGLHAVVGILEHAFNHTTTKSLFSNNGKFL